jgi:hypothetical protein
MSLAPYEGRLNTVPTSEDAYSPTLGEDSELQDVLQLYLRRCTIKHTCVQPFFCG